MINLMQMKLYPYFNRQISIPTNEEKPYNIIFVSENSDFLNVYPKLNIRRQFAKKVTYIPFKNPRVIVVQQNLLPYRKALGLLPIMKPDNSNTFIDTNEFFLKLDSTYGKESYKRPIVLSKIISYLTDCKRFGGYNSVLMYHVDLSKDVPEQFINRRSIILAMISQVGEGSFPFDNVVLAIEQGGSIKYMSIYNRAQKVFESSRIFGILKRLSPKAEEETDQVPVTESVEQDEKDSIMRFIDKHRKNKVLTS